MDRGDAVRRLRGPPAGDRRDDAPGDVRRRRTPAAAYHPLDRSCAPAHRRVHDLGLIYAPGAADDDDARLARPRDALTVGDHERPDRDGCVADASRDRPRPRLGNVHGGGVPVRGGSRVDLDRASGDGRATVPPRKRRVCGPVARRRRAAGGRRSFVTASVEILR